jgi:hypothetical protein
LGTRNWKIEIRKLKLEKRNYGPRLAIKNEP